MKFLTFQGNVKITVQNINRSRGLLQIFSAVVAVSFLESTRYNLDYHCKEILEFRPQEFTLKINENKTFQTSHAYYKQGTNPYITDVTSVKV